MGCVPRKYTKEYCTKIAAKYQYRCDFIKGNKDTYEGARRYGYLDEVCAHMKPKRQMPSKEEYGKIAKKYLPVPDADLTSADLRQSVNRNSGGTASAEVRYLKSAFGEEEKPV